MKLLLLISLMFCSIYCQDKPNVELGCRECGMFSAWMDVLMLCEQYDKGMYSGMKVDFKDNGLYYEKEKGENWWEYYCEPIFFSEQNDCHDDYHSDYHHVIGNPPFSRGDIEHYISREEANYLFNKYIHVKKEILCICEEYVQKNFKDKNIICVHYRGTDKITEVPLVPYYEFYVEILDEIKKNPNSIIFVASDEDLFVLYLTSIFNDKVYYQNIQRADRDQPLHIHSSSPYQHGKDAIIDAILLSKGNILIRSSSNLSRWSTYFNPLMKVIEMSCM